MIVSDIYDAIDKAKKSTYTLYDYGVVQVLSTDYAFIKPLLETLETLDFLLFSIKVCPRKIWPRLLLIGDVVIGIGENVFGYVVRDFGDRVRFIQKEPDDLKLSTRFKFVKKTLLPNSKRYDYISISQRRGRPTT